MSDWRPIAEAPKGGGAEKVTDPNWVEPPILLLFLDGEIVIGYWDWYYAEGGYGFNGRSAWINTCNESMQAHIEPTHFMPLPAPPALEVLP